MKSTKKSKMATSKAIMLRICILVLCIVIMFVLLDEKYVWIGECASICYYNPLTMWDRIVFAVIGIVGLLVTIKLTKPKRVGTILLSGLYVVIIIAFSIFGNQLMEMPTEHWPHEYHPQPIAKAAEINYSDKYLVGCWERTYYEASTDSVTFLSPLVEFSDDNMFANGDTLFYYTYHLQHDTLTIHRPNNAMQEYKILRLTSCDFTVKLIYDELFSYFGPSEITDSVTISFKRVPNTYVAKKPLPNIDL